MPASELLMPSSSGLTGQVPGEVIRSQDFGSKLVVAMLEICGSSESFITF